VQRQGYVRLPGSAAIRRTRAGRCRHRFVRCPDNWLQITLRLPDCADSSQRSRLDQCHSQPDSGVGCTPDHRGFPWDGAARYMIRDRDRICGTVVTRRLRATGVRDNPIAPASPWQNGFAERLIGSIRRECLDHIIVFGEAHLRRILKIIRRLLNSVRTHRSLHKDAPISRPIHQTGIILSQPILGGLHHHYVRV
jgi:Integrase core domain